MDDGPISTLILFGAILAGLPLLGLGLWLFARRIELRRGGERATVTVTGYAVRPDFDGTSHWFHPVVRWSGGRVTLTQGTPRPRWPEGSRLPVRYRAEAPERMVVDRFADLFTVPLVALAMGAGLLGMAAVAG